MDESYPLGIDFSILRPALACAIWSSPRLLGRRCCSSSQAALARVEVRRFATDDFGSPSIQTKRRMALVEAQRGLIRKDGRSIRPGIY